MDELDEKLKNYYELVKSRDAASAPDFNELIVTSSEKNRKRRVSVYLKVAASLALVALIAWFYEWNSPKKETPIPSSSITESLMRDPEYLWEWKSPTQSLMASIEFEQHKNKK